MPHNSVSRKRNVPNSGTGVLSRANQILKRQPSAGAFLFLLSQSASICVYLR